MNNLTSVFVLKACGRTSSLVNGEQIHSRVFQSGFASFLYVSNALIHMYGCCGHIGFARKVFDKMHERDLVSWNSLICGYFQNDRYTEVLALCDAMRASEVKADSVTLVKVLIACGHLGNTEYMDSTVKYMEESNIDLDVYLGNTLIDMYGRRGKTELAQRVFDRMADRNIVSWNAMITAHAKAWNSVAARNLFDQMPKRDVISWTSMITCYCQANQFSDAVRLFQEMMATKVKADEKTVASVLSACAHLGMLDVGVAVHDYIQENSVKMDIYVGNALIDMYCKCGIVKKALKVFQEMKARDSVSWTSVISGLAVNGFANDAVDIFSQMLCKGIQPTHGTFVGILLACSHAGLVDKGISYFESMEKVYGLVPEMKHYGCVVDVLSRSGQLDKAYKFIKKMPFQPDVVVWRILLSACKVHGDMALAEIVTKKILELDPCGSGNYVLLSNAYAGADRWHDATKVRERMVIIDSQKPSGCSSIELTGVM